MIDDTVPHFPCQIQTFAVIFELFHDAQALLIVLESLRQQFVKHLLACMSERRMPEIVTHGDRFGEILVEPQCAGDRSGDLRDLKRVRQPRAVVIALRCKKHLRFMLQPAERF